MRATPPCCLPIWKPKEAQMPELDTLGAVIKTTYEGEANTNAFTDAEKSKLAGIEAGAQVNVPAPVQSVNGQTGAVTLAAADVGALPDSYTPPAAPVQSVNGQTGAVTLTAGDVGALPDDYTPPAAPVQSVAGKTGAVALEVGDVTGLQGILDDLEQRLAALEDT